MNVVEDTIAITLSVVISCGYVVMRLSLQILTKNVSFILVLDR
jgi:hypothetical protein